MDDGNLIKNAGSNFRQNNFSIQRIPAGTEITIPQNQQMIVHQALTIEKNAGLVIECRAALILRS